VCPQSPFGVLKIYGVPSQSSFYKQLTEKRNDGRLCHLLVAKILLEFHYDLPQTHMASSICLRATIFQNREGTLWTHSTLLEPDKFNVVLFFFVSLAVLRIIEENGTKVPEFLCNASHFLTFLSVCCSIK
jgi:hypothetical protein